MKKSVLFLCVSIVFVQFLFPMNSEYRTMIDYSSHKNYQINFDQKFKSKQNEIPQLFSFADVWRGYNMLNDKNKVYVNHNLSGSLLFSFALCPQDIRLKILTRMLDNDEEAAKIFDISPILKVFVRYNDIRRYAPLKISNKIYSAGRLLRMTHKEINDLKNIQQPFFVIERIVGAKNSIVSETTCQKIKTMSQSITEGLRIREVEDDYADGCLFEPLSMSVISLLSFPYLSCSVATGLVCCLQGFFSVLYYRQASLNAQDVTL